jgi:demethylmenaquinone methyltransferase/2-methoxy-6-polyprenyl-1,4-benzoquinol methylase
VKPVTQSNYDRLSRWYDALAGSEAHFVRQAVDRLDLLPGERVLEIGCGTGKALSELAARTGPGGLALGLDLSAGMLRRAARRTGPSLSQADALALPCAAASFDAALVTFTLEIFSDAEIGRVLGEVRRVLRPGGRLGLVSLLETDAPGWMERTYVNFNRRYPDRIDCRPIRPGARLREAGFALAMEDRRLLWGLPVCIMLAVKEAERWHT